MSKKLILSVTIKDCEVQTFRAGGKGGQAQNKRDSGVRVIHRPSGAVGESREERSQLQNKKKAFKKMGESAKFNLWIQKMTNQTINIEAEVDKEMRPENIKVELFKNGKWISE